MSTTESKPKPTIARIWPSMSCSCPEIFFSVFSWRSTIAVRTCMSSRIAA